MLLSCTVSITCTTFSRPAELGRKYITQIATQLANIMIYKCWGESIQYDNFSMFIDVRKNI